MDPVEEHLDVLQNIEWAVTHVYRREPTLVDFDVENVYSALISYYVARARSRPLKPVRLNERAEMLFDAVKAVCDWRLGEGDAPEEGLIALVTVEGPGRYDVILACLKRLRKSVQRWTKEGGRQGYLRFVSDFVK